MGEDRIIRNSRLVELLEEHSMLEFDVNQPHFDGIENKKSLRQRFSLVLIWMEVSTENAHCRAYGVYDVRSGEGCAEPAKKAAPRESAANF